MCGIAGIIATGDHRPRAEELTSLTRKMTDPLAHRGPDDADIWVDAARGIGLGHRRLSIIDVSPTGRQPMSSASGRYVITYNGEIYNYRELRRELDGRGHAFRGSSDTEVLLAAISEWGVVGGVQRCNGMFAFALLDREDGAVHLARDRLGEKPLYYADAGEAIVFGSELKALRAHPDFDDTIDRGALALFLRHQYVPAPYSIYATARKVPPASIVTIAPGRPQTLSCASYWSFREVAERGVQRPFGGDLDAAVAELDELVRDAVKRRMVADVPLGAFLSGGIDSSTIVAMMQAQSDRPVKTFTIGFGEAQYNEAELARQVAGHLGTEHTELYVTPAEAQSVIPELPTMYDEPFADSSQIPTFLVSRLARSDVTVALSGDGGDELFAGYNRYAWAPRIWSVVGRVPGGVRRRAARLLLSRSSADWDALWARLPGRSRRLGVHPGHRAHQLAGVLATTGRDDTYRRVVSHWTDPTTVALGAAEPPTPLTTADGPALPGFVERMMYLDTVTYLPDDILVKLDRASMAVSLEGRVPFLDHRVVEFAWSLPQEMKIRGDEQKVVLRRLLSRYVPPALVDRPKMGFGVPIDVWLRGPLRDWAEELLRHERLEREGFLDPAAVRSVWQAHLEGRQDRHFLLWDVLMFQSWLEHGR